MTTAAQATEHIQIAQEGAVLCIRMNRPEKKNALSLAMYEGLIEGLARAESDQSVRVVFITGILEAFTSGNDVLDFMNAPPTGDDSPVIRFLRALTTMEKPLVAAVNGVAIGVGTTMLLHCDLVYAGSKARFQMPFVNLGLCPEAASSLLLPRLMGYSRASELLLLGKKFEAEEAYDYGLVNAVYESDLLESKALEQAQLLAAQPPASVRITKALLRRAMAAQVQDTMEEEGRYFLERLGSEEAAEAFTAFVERRKPDFSRFT